jgi:dihydroorotate dehydrogenase (NAD+) catalytic subunit
VIELAPNWKLGLSLEHPLLLAAGGFTPDQFPNAPRIGAFVTLLLTRRAHPAAPPPRVVPVAGGALLRTGAANPGLSVLSNYSRAWQSSSVPIIVAFASQAVRDWVDMTNRVNRVHSVSGIELNFNPTIEAPAAIRAVRNATELPILAKLDLDIARDVAVDCFIAGANTLVIGRAPRVMRMIDGKPWFGRMYGPAAKPITLRVLAEVAQRNLGAPIVASGGVHSIDDVTEFLAAGAVAVEVDTAMWVGWRD